MESKLIIYDGSCAYCRGFIQLVRVLDRKGVISSLPFDDPRVHELLRAQFEDRYGFAMYLFERDEARVSWGARAAQRIVESISLPRGLGRLAFRLYPSLVGLVSRLAHRTRKVCGPGCVGGGDATLVRERSSAELCEETLQRMRELAEIAEAKRTPTGSPRP